MDFAGNLLIFDNMSLKESLITPFFSQIINSTGSLDGSLYLFLFLQYDRIWPGFINQVTL